METKSIKHSPIKSSKKKSPKKKYESEFLVSIEFARPTKEIDYNFIKLKSELKNLQKKVKEIIDS
jgi:hypothetical protein